MKRTIVGALAAVSLLSLGGCPTPPCPRLDTPSMSVGAPDGGSAYLAGESVTLLLPVPIDACTGAPAERIRAQMSAPDGTEVPVTLKTVVASGEGSIENTGGSRSITASFPTSQPGWYQGRVTFDFNFGTLQTQVLASERHAGDAAVALGASACATLVELPSGALLCGGQVFREGLEAQDTGGFAADVSDDVAWVVGANALSQLRDSPQGKLQTLASTPVAPQSPKGSPLAGADDVVLVDPHGATLYRSDGAGGIAVVQTIAFADAPLLAMRSGARLFTFAASFGDGGVGDASTRVCPWEITPAGLNSRPCSLIPGEPVGITGDLLWLQVGSVPTGTVAGPRSLRLARRMGEQFELVGSFRVPDDWVVVRPAMTGAPLFQNAVGTSMWPRVPRPTPDSDVVVEVYTRDLFAPRANEKFVWGQSVGGGVTVLRR